MGFIAVALGCVLGLLLFFQISYFESARTIVLTVTLTVILLVLMYVFLVMGFSYMENKKSVRRSGREKDRQLERKPRAEQKPVAARRPAAVEKAVAAEKTYPAAEQEALSFGQDMAEGAVLATVGELLKEYEEGEEQEKLYVFPVQKEVIEEVTRDDAQSAGREPELANSFARDEREEQEEERVFDVVMWDTVREETERREAEEEPFEFELFELADEEEVQAEQERAEREISAVLSHAAERARSWDYEVVDEAEALIYETAQDGYARSDLWGVAEEKEAARLAWSEEEREMPEPSAKEPVYSFLKEQEQEEQEPAHGQKEADVREQPVLDVEEGLTREEEREESETAFVLAEREERPVESVEIEEEPAVILEVVEETIIEIEPQPEEEPAAAIKPWPVEEPAAAIEPQYEEEPVVAAIAPQPEAEERPAIQEAPEQPAAAARQADLASLSPQERREAEMSELKALVAQKQYDTAIKKVFGILNAGYVMTPNEKHQMKLILLTLKEKTKK
ncbi:MAG TPA: hypothetical protein DEB31_08330 [Clostridiales bacterium]|nr:hypothetical protein [Clostridiales bacterium]